MGYTVVRSDGGRVERSLSYETATETALRVEAMSGEEADIVEDEDYEKAAAKAEAKAEKAEAKASTSSSTATSSTSSSSSKK